MGREGLGETGRVAPRLRRYRADWIPAYAGMTGLEGAALRAMG